MNNILKSIIFCAGAVSMASCSDFLDQYSPSELTEEVVYNSAEYTKQAVNRIYTHLTKDHMYGARLPLNFSTNSDIELVDATKEADIKTSGNERSNCNYYSTPDWNRLSQTWEAMYMAIESANEVVYGVRNNGMQEDFLVSLGEALTLRAMLYYDLVKNFGDVPMRLEPTNVDGSNIYSTKEKRDVIYEQLIKDLQEAAQYLPWQGEQGYTSERVNKGFALGLTARIALAQAGYSIREAAIEGYETASFSDATYPTQRPAQAKRDELYDIALDALNELISSGRHNLNASFEEVWDMSNKLVLDNGARENLYEVAHGLEFSGEMGYTAGVRLTNESTWGFTNASGKVKLTAPYFWSFDQNDKRRDITIAPYEYKNDGTNGFRQVMQGNNPWAMYVAKWDFRRMSEAWKTVNTKVQAKTGYGINWIVMRYSDALLMYAEAMNERHGSTTVGACGLSAMDALREVRQRNFDDASKVQEYLSKIGSKEDFFNAIVNERAWEFGAEGIRKYDLIRWGILWEKIQEAADYYVQEVAPNAPEKLYYKYQTKIHPDGTIETLSDVDYSSVCWYSAPSSTSGYTSQNFWGRDASKGADSDNGKIGYMLSGGLNETVKNRHVFPISYKDVNLSGQNGYGNSYGW